MIVTNDFLHDLENKLLQEDLYKNCDELYEKLSEIFVDILNYHARLKEKQTRGNHAPFMNKELSKAVLEKSKTRNKYLKWPSRGNYVFYKKSKNKCNSLTKKQRKSFSWKLQKMGLCLIKSFGVLSNLF